MSLKGKATAKIWTSEIKVSDIAQVNVLSYSTLLNMCKRIPKMIWCSSGRYLTDVCVCVCGGGTWFCWLSLVIPPSSRGEEKRGFGFPNPFTEHIQSRTKHNPFISLLVTYTNPTVNQVQSNQITSSPKNKTQRLKINSSSFRPEHKTLPTVQLVRNPCSLSIILK